MKHVISPENRAELARLVAQVERNTAGELVTVVLDSSSTYAGFRIGWAAALALLIACVTHLVWPGLPVIQLLGAQAILAVMLVAAFGWAPLLRLVVPRWTKQQAVDQHAKRLFLELGLTETRDRSGVLILLSEFERRVVILGDRGIHEHLGTKVWEALVTELVGSIRTGNAMAGLQSIIRRLGHELASKFPPRPDDTNELPDTIVFAERSKQ